MGGGILKKEALFLGSEAGGGQVLVNWHHLPGPVSGHGRGEGMPLDFVWEHCNAQSFIPRPNIGCS